MVLIALWSVFFLATLAWLCLILWRSSPRWAVATAVFGPLAGVVPVIRERHNVETRATVPFLANLAFAVLLAISIGQWMHKTAQEQAAREARAAEAAAQAASATASPVDDDGLPRDPIDRFSLTLREAGLRYSLSPIPSAELGSGAIAGAQLVIAAPASDGRELPGLLLRCASGKACQRLALAHKARATKGEPARQVTQNGMMLLVVQPTPELEGLHHVVQGVFRRTDFASS